MKTLRIVQLVLLIVLTLTLLGVLFAFVTGQFSFGMQFKQFSGPAVEIFDHTYSDEPISNVYVDIIAANITFETSEADEVRVVYFAQENEKEEPKVTTRIVNGRLEISEESSERFILNRIFTENRSLIVYLPADFDGVLECSVVSGSIRANRDFEVTQALLNSTSGSINLQNIFAERIVVKNVSGSFNANHLKAQEIDVLLVSGSINIQYYSGQGEIKSTSGSININEYSGAGAVISTSGSINVNLFELTNDLYLSTTSGSVKVTVLDPELSAYCDFSTTMGIINAHFAQEQKQVVGSSLNANLGDNPDHKLVIRVTSGNIRVS